MWLFPVIGHFWPNDIILGDFAEASPFINLWLPTTDIEIYNSTYTVNDITV